MAECGLCVPQSIPVSRWRVLENWLILHGAKGMQESVNLLCLFFPLLPSKFLPGLTGEKLSTVWPRVMIPASTCNATSTYMCEIPPSLFLQNASRTGPGAVPYGSGSSSRLAQAVVVLLTCPPCLTSPGLLVPVGDELDPPGLLAIRMLPRDLLLY